MDYYIYDKYNQGDFLDSDEEDQTIDTRGKSPELDFAIPGHPLYSYLHDTSKELHAYTVTLNSKYYSLSIQSQYEKLREHIQFTLSSIPYYFTFELTKAGHPHGHGIVLCDDTQLRCDFNNKLIKIGHVLPKKCYSKYNWFKYMFKTKYFSSVTNI